MALLPIHYNWPGRSADARERVADEQVHDPGAAERRLQADHARLVGYHLPDDRRVRPEGVGAERAYRRRRAFARHDRDHAALARDVHGVDAEQFARAAHLGPYRDVVLDDQHADVGGASDLVEYGRDAAPGRVAHRPNAGYRRQQVSDQPVQRRGVRHHVRLDVEFAARQHDRDAVVAHRPGHDDRVTRPGSRHPERDVARQDADPGGVDVAPVGLAPLHDFRVPRDDGDTSRRGGVPHGGREPDQVGDGEALLEDEPGRQVHRRGTGYGQVVDRAVDRQVADVPAGEEQRGHHERVGGQRDRGPITRLHRQPRGVLQRFQQRVPERLEEDRLDQRVGRLPARPMRHRDAFFPELGPPAAGPLDAVE